MIQRSAIVTRNDVDAKETSGSFGEPTLVMALGWRMDDHGREALIFGSSHCPDANDNKTSEGGYVLIDDQSATVAATVVDATTQSRRQEIWAIERKKDRTIVKRPDKSDVMPWGK